MALNIQMCFERDAYLLSAEYLVGRRRVASNAACSRLMNNLIETALL